MQKLPHRLREQALWIVMDPWEQQPREDLELCPNQDRENLKAAEKIHSYTRELPHVIVCCDPEKPVTPCLRNRKNYHYSIDRVTEYLEKHSLAHCVYTGFHHGRCILERPTGVRALTAKGFTCWVVRDLACVFCEDDPEKQDQRTAEFTALVQL